MAERELRRGLRASAARPHGDLDVDDLRRRLARIRRRRRVVVAVASAAAVAAVVLPAWWFADGTEPPGGVFVDPGPTATGEATPPRPAVDVPVVDAELVDGSAGWASTSDGILWTLDSGHAWFDVTPAAANPQRLRATYFLDRVHGWTVELPGESGGVAVVHRTTDGGNEWSSSTVDPPPPPVGTYGEVSIDFIDPRTGWLLVGMPGGVSSGTGRLFSTTDGGASWAALGTTPVAHDVTFASTRLGWVTSGAPTDGSVEMYVTRDGGRTFERTPIPRPQTYQRARVFATTPHPSSETAAAVAVSLRTDSDRSAIAVSVTDDGGRTWQVVHVEGVATDALLPAMAPPFDLTSAGEWIVATHDGSVVRTSTEDQDRERSLPDRLVDLSFTDPVNDGWVLRLAGSSCSVGREACLMLLDERNGEWQPQSPEPQKVAACARDATSREAAPDEVADTVDLYFRCSADDGVPPVLYRVARPAARPEAPVSGRIADAVGAWLDGPTDDEGSRGYRGGLALGPDLLRGVTVDAGTATVDLGAELTTVDNITTSHASAVFITQIAATVLATDEDITGARFTIEGSCQRWAELFESDDCHTIDRRSVFPTDTGSRRAPGSSEAADEPSEDAATAREAPDRIVVAREDGRVITVSSDDGRPINEISRAPAGARIVGSLAVTDDGATVYFATTGDTECDYDLVEANTDGGAQRVVGRGRLPAISPDGSRLAYVTGSRGCPSELVVRDLGTGDEARWASGFGDAWREVHALSWLDGERLVYEVNIEESSELRTFRTTSPADATLAKGRLVGPRGEGSWGEPVYFTPLDALLVHEVCCHPDFDTTIHVIAVDPDDGSTVDELFDVPRAIDVLSVDAARRHALLTLRNGDVYRWSGSDRPTKVTTGAVAADW